MKVLLVLALLSLTGCTMFDPYVDPTTGLVQEPMAATVLKTLGSVVATAAPPIGTAAIALGGLITTVFGAKKAHKAVRAKIAARRARKTCGT